MLTFLKTGYLVTYSEANKQDSKNNIFLEYAGKVDKL